MEITAAERGILDGKSGDSLRKLLAVLVDLGEAAGATRLIPISSAHVAGVSYLTGKEGLRTFLVDLAKSGIRARVRATTNPCGMDRGQWAACGTDPGFAAKQAEIIAAYETLGIRTTLSCTPYQFPGGNLPWPGEHLAWSESSAIITANSYFGGRTNRESGLSALAAAMTGLTPEYGLHLDAARAPNLHVRIVKAKALGTTELSMLGEALKRDLVDSVAENGPIPFVTGLPPLALHEAKAFLAPLGTHGCALAHIGGTTPEAEWAASRAPAKVIPIGIDDLEALAREYRPSEQPDLVVIGCPQASAAELRTVADLLRGKRLRQGIELWVFTSDSLATSARAEGVAAVIESAGARLLADTCPEVISYPGRIRSVLADSMKAVEYIRSKDLSNLPCGVLDTRSCVRVATGEQEVG